MVQRLKAVFWDVDGTLAETEMAGHRLAFNRAFSDAALPWHWDAPTYSRLLSISGGRDRIATFLTEVEGGVPEPARLDRLQASKQAHYSQLVRGGGLAPRPGVTRLMAEIAAAGILQVIVTASGRSSVAGLMKGSFANLRQVVRFWICGEDVMLKKPHPEAYQLAIERAQVDPRQVLVLEDSAQGLAAADSAGLSTLVTLSQHSSADPLERFDAALAVLDGLGDGTAPALVRRGPACSGGHVTLAYLQDLLAEQPERDG